MSNLGNLEITQYNTFKNSYLREVDVDKFMKQLAKKINKYNIDIKHDLGASIHYEADVYKEEDDLYEIFFARDKDVGGYYSYYINTKGYPHLKEQLDEFCDITKIHDIEENAYDSIEENGKGTTEENKAYLNYLDAVKKDVALSNLKFISPLITSSAVFAITAFLISQGVGDYALVSTLGTISGLVATIPTGILALNEYFDNGRTPKENIKLGKLLKKKMAKIKQKIYGSGKANLKTDTAVHNNVTKEELYRDNIINYMNSIMNAANKLDGKNKKEKLLALREILDEYTSKSQELNNGKGLTLKNGNRDVMIQTIDKLTSLEMEIADLLNQKKNNEKYSFDSEKFMEELNKNIESVKEKEMVMTSSGRVSRK